MNLDRLQRILKARWWVLVLIVAVSVVVATLLTDFRNEQRPMREAVASITFLQQLGEVDDSAALIRLENADSLALEVNEAQLADRLHLLAPWEIATIIRDDRTKRLQFVGRADRDAEAIAIAEDLRNMFLDEEPFTTVVSVEGQLEALANRIRQLRTLIAEATTVPPPAPLTQADAITEAGLQAIQAQINALTEQYRALSVELLNPVLRSSAAIEAERDTVLPALVALQLQFRAQCVGSGSALCEGLTASVDEAAAGERTSEEALAAEFEVLFWQIEAQQLEEAYRALLLRSLEVGTIVTIDEVELVDSTLDPIDLATNQALAVVAGLLVGLIGLMLADRIRKPIWTALEVDSRVALPEIAPRGRSAPTGAWYVSTGPGARRSGIQTLRAIIEGLGNDQGGTVGITGLAVNPEDIQELSADLAAAVAVSGDRALLIDANFGNPSDLVEFGHRSANLAKVLATIETGDASPAAALSALLDDGDEIIEGLKALPAGGRSHDAPDLLSRWHFAALLEAAKARFDVVIVSGADVASPITQVLSQRLDHLVFLGSAGHSLEADFTAAKREFADRRAETVGMALLTSRRTRLNRLLGRFFTPRRSRNVVTPTAGAQPTAHRPSGRRNRVASTRPVNGQTPPATYGQEQPDATTRAARERERGSG